MDKAALAEVLAQKKARLANYLSRETYMLSTDGVLSYGVGTRNLRRYETELSEIRAAITALEQEIKELEGQLTSKKPRKAVAVVPWG